MSGMSLEAKAHMLLERRGQKQKVLDYFRSQWPRRVHCSSAFPAIAAIEDQRGAPMVASAGAAFELGRISRDLQSSRALAQEWKTTSALLDWPKIEKLVRIVDDDAREASDLSLKKVESVKSCSRQARRLVRV